MYVPKRYVVTDQSEIDRFLEANSFATVISCAEGVPSATHLPITLKSQPDGPRLLRGHFARANPQWRKITPETEVLLVFLGAHTYISPRWYDHLNVPTWNYMSVHCYGKMRFLEGEELGEAMSDLVRMHEPEGAVPATYRFETLPADFVQDEIQGIVGFEVMVHRTEATYKLSQNRDAKNHAAVIEQLKKRGDENSKAVAEAMEAWAAADKR